MFLCGIFHPMTTFTYTDVLPETITKMAAELSAGGALVTNPATNCWNIVGHGVTAKATYDPGATSLIVRIASKPFFVPDSFINTGILKALGRG